MGTHCHTERGAALMVAMRTDRADSIWGEDSALRVLYDVAQGVAMISRREFLVTECRGHAWSELGDKDARGVGWYRHPRRRYVG